MDGLIHFYGAPLDGPLVVTHAAVGLVVYEDRVALALDIASENTFPEDVDDVDEDALSQAND